MKEDTFLSAEKIESIIGARARADVVLNTGHKLPRGYREMIASDVYAVISGEELVVGLEDTLKFQVRFKLTDIVAVLATNGDRDDCTRARALFMEAIRLLDATTTGADGTNESH